MPYKDAQMQVDYLKSYSKEYYQKNRKKLLKYRKARREKDRQIWRDWYARKKDFERQQKINLGTVYRSFKKYS